MSKLSEQALCAQRLPQHTATSQCNSHLQLASATCWCYLQRLGDTGRQVGESDRRHWETSGRHDPASGLQTQGDKQDWDKRETRPRRRRHPTTETGRHRKTSGRHDPEPASQHLASDRGDWETQGEKRETRPQRLGDTGRQAGDTTPQPASQHLASDRRASVTASGIQIQGDKRETRPGASVTHDPRASVTKNGMGDTGRQAGDTTLEPASTASGI